jgi:pimeloyl-ACP methyl ester carboxylesterase
MLMGTPLDPRLVKSKTAQTMAFRAGRSLLATPPETITIPYEQTSLPGYFFAVDASGMQRPTVLLLGGYDGPAEELYFLNGAAALARGYNVLAFDGPGQGSALLQQHLVPRPDWDKVVSPVLDYAATRADVDPARIALIGLSLGAHLGPRAAAAEPRLAALITDCGSYDLFAAALERMPGPLARGLANRSPRATKVVTRILSGVANKPTAGWALRRGQLVHGVESPAAYLEALRGYTLSPHAPKIACPTLVCSAEGDDIGASAGQLADALTCENEHLIFTASTARPITAKPAPECSTTHAPSIGSTSGSTHDSPEPRHSRWRCHRVELDLSARADPGMLCLMIVLDHVPTLRLGRRSEVSPAMARRSRRVVRWLSLDPAAGERIGIWNTQTYKHDL